MKYKQYNDYELLYMVRENELIKDILYKIYEPIIHKISRDFYEQYKYYGYEYSDFLQEANILFEKAIMKYDESRESIFYTFVNLCIKRGLITFCKKISNSNKNLPLFNYVNLADYDIADNKNDINDWLENYDIDRFVKQKIYDMPLEYSTILELKTNGFNYREISVLLDIPGSTVEYRIRRIRREIGKYRCKETI